MHPHCVHTYAAPRRGLSSRVASMRHRVWQLLCSNLAAVEGMSVMRTVRALVLPARCATPPAPWSHNRRPVHPQAYAIAFLRAVIASHCRLAADPRRLPVHPQAGPVVAACCPS